MRLTQANIAGLTPARQQSEMKSILAGTWPPLRPLPVFKYETVEYRATIEFDKKRGEWVCRKTSLPSNKVQELRGGLREITLALPHGEGEIFTEDAEGQEPGSEKDTNRRLQAIHDWRENYESGARYFELQDCLSEGQRTEMDDSLRLSLTARQLQFNPRNLADVFDALSTAGGRFATLVELAKRHRAKLRTAPQTQGDQALPEAEGALDEEKPSLGIHSGERVTDNHDPLVRDEQAVERCTDADEFPAVSIKDVLPIQDQASPEERVADLVPQHFEIGTCEIVDADVPSLDEQPYQEGQRSPRFAAFAAEVRTGLPSADRIEGSSWRFPVFEISAFQAAVFALLSLFAVIAFTVGLTVGRRPLGSRLREAPKSMLAADVKSPALPDQAHESTSRIPTPPVTRSDEPAGTYRLDHATPSEEKSKDSTRGSDYLPEVRSADSESSPTSESKPSAGPEVNAEHGGATWPMMRNVPPPASSKLPHAPKAVGAISSAPRNYAPYGLTSAIGAEPHLPRPFTILVTVPGRGSRPFRVSFPKKPIAATSSLAMTSQLSVLVSPEPVPAAAHRPARLEAGELVSFVWPRYPRPGDRYGSAEAIRVRATIGQLGQVQEVKFLGGSVSLLPATTRAIRQWHYRPTLLNKRPVRALQDVTIEFRPPPYSPHASTPRPSHKLGDK